MGQSHAEQREEDRRTLALENDWAEWCEHERIAFAERVIIGPVYRAFEAGWRARNARG